MLPLAAPLLVTSLRDRPPDRHGKVRDLYDSGDYLLVVISAFDDDRARSIVPNHVVSTDPAAFPAPAPAADCLHGRSILVRLTDPLPIECVARGYLSGSAWKDYSSPPCPPFPTMWWPRPGKNTSRRFSASLGGNCHDL